MTTFLLIRHAAHGLLGRTLAGRMPGVHLSEEGKAQAERLADRLSHLPIDAIYSSPLERACETAEPLARRVGLLCEEITELDLGDWTGSDFDQVEGDQRWRYFNSYRSGTRIPGGEMMLETQVRAVAKMDGLRVAHPGGTVAVVTHGDVIRALIGYYVGSPLDLFLRFEISPASLSIVKLHEYGPQVLLMNYTGDLPVAYTNSY
jgi:probable phosphomutase (TIGR03848 family)